MTKMLIAAVAALGFAFAAVPAEACPCSQNKAACERSKEMGKEKAKSGKSEKGDKAAGSADRV